MTGGATARSEMVWNAVLSSNDDELAATVRLTNVAGDVVEVSLPDNGRFPILPTLTHSQPDQWARLDHGLALANFLLAQRNQAEIKITFQLYLHAPARDLWLRGIDLRLGDRIVFRHRVTYPDGPFIVDVGLIVTSLAHSISPTGWVVTVATSSVVDSRDNPDQFDWDVAEWDINLWDAVP